MQKKGLAVVAVGGNALIKDKNHQTVPDQYQAAADTMAHIATMIEDGWDVVVTHGNGPQVGLSCAARNSLLMSFTKSRWITAARIRRARSGICSSKLYTTCFSSAASKNLLRPS